MSARGTTPEHREITTMPLINQLLAQLAARLMPSRYRRNQLSIRARAAMLASERPSLARARQFAKLKGVA
ncbi:hypothetical protein GCM10023095_04180 [Pseudaeromonas paramecii]|uniref:Uncharacterized protein n=2 Tax=Pseudaeromonas paramecii TaxID=2138166 RepID=A0ABP8PVR7_9GAMM